MMDRSAARPTRNWLNPYLQTLVDNATARSSLRADTLINPTTQVPTEGQQQVRRRTTQDATSRTTNLAQSRHRNPSHGLGNASERFIAPSYENSQTHAGSRIREQNTRHSLPSFENNVEEPVRMTSIWRTNENLLEPNLPDPAVKNSKQLNEPSEERLACEITMSYTPTSTAEKSDRKEITVMQRYSTGEASLIFRGYLTKGDTFSFKSLRRSTSSLSLAFYVEGLFDSLTNECCEFKCIQTNSDAHDAKQFLFKDTQKANPCEKCRKDYAEKLLLNNDKNTPLLRRSKKASQNYPQTSNSFKPSSSGNDGKGSSNQQKQKTSKTKKPKASEVPDDYQAGTTTVIPPSTTQSSSIHTKGIPFIPVTQSGEPKPTKKPDGDAQISIDVGEMTLTTDNIDAEALLQMLASHIKQNATMSTENTQSWRTRRHPKSVENFFYIMENRIKMSENEQQNLRGLINLGFSFDDINGKDAVAFLKRIFNEKLILIISKSSMENLCKAIQDESVLCAIYVIDASQQLSFASKCYRGTFPNIGELCSQLKSDLPMFSNNLTYISSIPANYAKMSTLNYVQALKDILLESDDKRDLKKEMIDFCREEYADNRIQLKLIDEFENNFQADDAIGWYLRTDTFLHKMVTRAFRVLDPDILYKYRYFIQHLHRQLTSLDDTSPRTVYGTFRIKKDLFDKMKDNQGSLLSFNEFLLLKKHPTTTEHPPPLNTDSKVIHFEIVLENGADYHDLGTTSDDILLTIGTMFCIKKVESIDEETFSVKLKTNNDIRKAGELITKDLRDAVRGAFPAVRMAKLMRQKDLHNDVEYFCSMLIDDPQASKDETANLTVGGLLHYLGTHYYEKKLYKQALQHLQNSLRVYLRVLPEDDVRLTPTYNNIGSIFHKQDLDEQALEYHQKAYEIQKNSKDPDMDSVAAYVGNIGSVLLKLRRYTEAVDYLKLDLKIKQQRHPNNDHADVAAKYHNLAGAQYKLKQYAEALDNYQKCLDIELKCHSEKNPTVSVTYYNMATALEELGRFEEAKDALEKAIPRLLLTKKEDDDDVKMQKRYLQRIEQKIFMKKLFPSA